MSAILRATHAHARMFTACSHSRSPTCNIHLSDAFAQKLHH